MKVNITIEKIHIVESFDGSRIFINESPVPSSHVLGALVMTSTVLTCQKTYGRRCFDYFLLLSGGISVPKNSSPLLPLFGKEWGLC